MPLNKEIKLNQTLLQTVKWYQILQCITISSFRQTFIYTQSNGQTVLFCNYSIYDKSFVYTQFKCQNVHREDPVRCYHSESAWTWKKWQLGVLRHSPNLQDLTFTIRWFNIIYQGGSGLNASTEIQSVYSTASADSAMFWTLMSIVANFCSAVVSMVLILPLISCSPSSLWLHSKYFRKFAKRYMSNIIQTSKRLKFSKYTL